jgi:hypothetical protein
VALLGLLPALSLWCVGAQGLPDWLRKMVSLGYASLIVVAFRVQPFTALSFASMAWVLLAFSIAFLAAAIYLVLRPSSAAAAPAGGLAGAAS